MIREGIKWQGTLLNDKGTLLNDKGTLLNDKGMY